MLFLSTKNTSAVHFLYIWQHRWITGKPSGGLKVVTALISPMVPIEIRSSVSSPVPWYFLTTCATSRRLCSIRIFFAWESPSWLFLKIIIFPGIWTKVFERPSNRYLEGGFLYSLCPGQGVGAFPENFEPFYNYFTCSVQLCDGRVFFLWYA